MKVLLGSCPKVSDPPSKITLSKLNDSFLIICVICIFCVFFAQLYLNWVLVDVPSCLQVFALKALFSMF